MRRQRAYVYRVFMIFRHMALVGFWHIKEELCKGFSKFSNKFPMHLNSKSEDHIIKPYLKHQLLRYVCFPKYFIRKHQDDKHGTKLMLANHRKHVEHEEHTDPIHF